MEDVRDVEFLEFRDRQFYNFRIRVRDDVRDVEFLEFRDREFYKFIKLGF